MRHDNGQRHEFGGFITGESKHQALVAGTLFFVQPLAFGDALRDVGRLPVDRRQDGAGVGIKAHLRGGVADFAHGLAHHFGVGDLRPRGDFAGYDHHAGFRQAFAGDPTVGVAFQQPIEDGVGNLLAHLGGLALGHGFRGEQEVFQSHNVSFALAARGALRCVGGRVSTDSTGRLIV
jgi:hypothetical protein